VKCDAKDNLVKCLVKTPIDFEIVKHYYISRNKHLPLAEG